MEIVLEIDTVGWVALLWLCKKCFLSHSESVSLVDMFLLNNKAHSLVGHMWLNVSLNT